MGVAIHRLVTPRHLCDLNPDVSKALASDRAPVEVLDAATNTADLALVARAARQVGSFKSCPKQPGDLPALWRVGFGRRLQDSRGSAAPTITFPSSVPAAVAIDIIAFVANSFNRPGFGASASDSARISNTNSSAFTRI